MTTFLKKNSVLIVLLIVLFLTYLFYLIFKDTPSNYVSFADYFASIVLLFGIVLSSFIYLSNSYAFFNKRLGRITNLIIKGIPEDIPFGRKVKSYLTSLLKDNKKVIIFLPYPTTTNREAILLQLLGKCTTPAIVSAG